MPIGLDSSASRHLDAPPGATGQLDRPLALIALVLPQHLVATDDRVPVLQVRNEGPATFASSVTPAKPDLIGDPQRGPFTTAACAPAAPEGPTGRFVQR